MKSTKQEAVGENIRTFRHDGMPEKQAIVAALEVQRRAKRKKSRGKNLGKYLHREK